MTRDPVCYAEVDEAEAANQGLESEENGRKYYFCSDKCKDRFDRDPGAFMEIYPDLETTDDERTDDYSV
jgi:YHS domain-containing protein